MAEAHLEMDDGRTLPLISLCHTADRVRTLLASCYRLERESRAELSIHISSFLLVCLAEYKRNEKPLRLLATEKHEGKVGAEFMKTEKVFSNTTSLRVQKIQPHS